MNARLESALPAGSDPRYQARVLSRTWETVLSGNRPRHAPRPLISESWERVRRLGVDPYHGNEVPPLPMDEVERQRQASGLIPVLDVLRGGLTSIADDGVHIMVITDAKGRLLWREGSTAVRLNAESLGFVEGARWDEGSVGTNGIGTALVVERPVQIFAAEHFVRSHHPWICTAAPLHDPVDGRLLGLVDVAGPAATVHPSTLALVDSVARLAQTSLREAQGAALAQLRCAAAPVLARIGGPAVVTDRNGWVAAADGVWPGDRVLLPSTFDGARAHIPALGRCLVEPLLGGWLIRVDSSEPERPTTVRLDLRERSPYIVVVAASGSWRHRLRPRHAEILLLLALGGSGLSAAELSLALFGDPAHTVTVRAELSRLRGQLGGLLEQRPYRFAPWLEVVCELPDDLATLLPQSSAPAIRTLRENAPAPS